jgi:hypothetical protein
MTSFEEKFEQQIKEYLSAQLKKIMYMNEHTKSFPIIQRVDVFSMTSYSVIYEVVKNIPTLMGFN